MAMIIFAMEWSMVNVRSNLQHGIRVLCMGIVAMCLAIILVATSVQLMYAVKMAWTRVMQTAKHACSKGMTDPKDVVFVQESPQPTRTMSSPWPMTPTLRLRPLRRGGRRRWSPHRRATTLKYDPPAQHHCGYAGVKAQKKGTIKDLREAVAQRVYTAFVNDEKVMGREVKSIVASEGHTLAAYMAEIRHTMWASIMEITYAAEHMGINVVINMGREGMHVVGDPKKAQFIIRLVKNHFVVEALHHHRWLQGRTQRNGATTSQCKRGGMQHAEQEDAQEPDWDPDARGQPAPGHNLQPVLAQLRDPPPLPVHPLLRGQVSPYDNAWVSKHAQGPFATTDIPRSAVYVLVVDGETQVGYMWAMGQHPVEDVINEFIQDVILETPIQTTPITATRWDEVARVQLHGQTLVRANPIVDLRVTAWELYQKHRELPLLREANTIAHMIAPKVCTLEATQLRVSMHAPWNELWTVIALDVDTWLVHARAATSNNSFTTAAAYAARSHPQRRKQE